MVDLNDRVRGALLGCAVGDALGLPAEGVSRQRAARMFRRPWHIQSAEGKKVKTDAAGYFSLPQVSRREVVINMRGAAIMPASEVLDAEAVGLDLVFAVERRCHLKLNAQTYADRKQVWAEVLDDKGKALTLFAFNGGGGWSSTTRWYISVNPATQAMGVSEKATWLVVHQGVAKHRELRRIRLALKPGEVTHVNL